MFRETERDVDWHLNEWLPQPSLNKTTAPTADTYQQSSSLSTFTLNPPSLSKISSLCLCLSKLSFLESNAGLKQRTAAIVNLLPLVVHINVPENYDVTRMWKFWPKRHAWPRVLSLWGTLRPYLGLSYICTSLQKKISQTIHDHQIWAAVPDSWKKNRFEKNLPKIRLARNLNESGPNLLKTMNV